MMKAIPAVAAAGRPQPARQGARQYVGERQLCGREWKQDKISLNVDTYINIL